MQITRRTIPGEQAPVALTIGNFDGVHLGHQAMIARLKRAAHRLGVGACVMTFEPHPREVLTPDRAPARLTGLREKLAQLARLGVDRAQICRFDRAFANITAKSFITHILLQEMDVRWLLIGEDFRFGARRSGNIDLLRQYFVEAEKRELEIMAPVMLDDQRVSSTAIRHALADGNLAWAAELLGRPFSISGRVVGGLKLGKKLGFPTANIHLKDRYPLPNGIFVVEANWKNDSDVIQRVRGVASLGVRPTILESAHPVLEAHLFDFDEDIYGKHLQIEFLHWLRDEQKFPDMTTLVAQIEQDVIDAKAYFSQVDAAAHSMVCLDC
ncbi:riboflavin biosynthesis protein RibF [Nitrosomonas stercoris]|uniref:Riboflavin biosynthesis protein n=1 Tax=Nitrosomonas stercoris TaxID=1444684 RepID=A0A4Y1YQU8_9PROT|nr:riboflavin biosynthesis protein RibF [Nitrosomonas stercoris]